VRDDVHFVQFGDFAQAGELRREELGGEDAFWRRLGERRPRASYLVVARHLPGFAGEDLAALHVLEAQPRAAVQTQHGQVASLGGGFALA
jgi:hypothetical protein